jgi:hypothetical protein
MKDPIVKFAKLETNLQNSLTMTLKLSLPIFRSSRQQAVVSLFLYLLDPFLHLKKLEFCLRQAFEILRAKPSLDQLNPARCYG